jgi:intracellular sulfur oxidation DsrE/DsrF family protein
MADLDDHFLRLRSMRSTILGFVFLSLVSTPVAAQQRASTGPVIMSGGPVYAVPDADFPTPMDTELKAVFELRAAAEDPSRMNQNIGTMARYLNLHARAGVPRENLRVAGVVHGGASLALLKDEYYREANGVDNPNKELIAEILASGGQLILCGQTAGARGITKDQLLPGVQLALSAMTALTVLQQQGYQVILW